jgi:phospholipid/cholesterol/gamma-HCH transport system permease protein
MSDADPKPTSASAMMAGPEGSGAMPILDTRAWPTIVRFVDRLWEKPTHWFEVAGEHMVLLGKATFWLFRRPFRMGIFLEAAEFIGVQSLAIVSLIGLFVGMVFALQLVSALRQFGGEQFVGATLGIALTRELAPVFTTIVIAARAGAGMATELGSMRITEQIDALATLAVNPIQYLVTPRVLASTIMAPLLSMLFVAVAMVGGYLVAVGLLGVDPGVFIEEARWIVDGADILQGIIKATIFGCALATISCAQGFFASGGAKGVGIGTTRAVVGSFVTILVLDYFLTDIILVLQHK